MATFAKTAGHQHRITPMRDYKLDSEISQFLQDSERIYPVDAVELSMEEHRKHYSAL
jgi:hypothetical protein